MRLVQIDVVGLQPGERCVDRLMDVLAGQSAVVRSTGSGRTEDFGEDLKALAPLARQRIAGSNRRVLGDGELSQGVVQSAAEPE